MFHNFRKRRGKRKIPVRIVTDKEALAEYLLQGVERPPRQPFRLRLGFLPRLRLPSLDLDVGRFRRPLRRIGEGLACGLGSILFHLVMLLVLAVWLLPDLLSRSPEPKEVRISFYEPTETVDDLGITERAGDIEREIPVPNDPDADLPEMERFEIPESRLPESMLEVDIDIEPARDPVDRETPASEAIAGTGSDGGGVYGRRSGGGREVAVVAGGGNTESENAVELALRWLAAHQSPEGGWDIDGYHARCPEGETCRIEGTETGTSEQYDAGLTGLALLAFLGRGNTHREGGYAPTVRSAVRYLLSIQHPNGRFGESFSGETYNQAFCTLALAELYAMTRDPDLRGPVERGVGRLVRAQQPGGGWDYRLDPGSGRNDASITGWTVMALKAAIVGEIHVPARTLLRNVRYWQEATRPDGWVVYANQGRGRPGGEARTGEGMAAVGLASRLFLGASPDHPDFERGTAILMTHLPDYDGLRRGSGWVFNNFYYWYYGSIALHQVGGDPWRVWNAHVRDPLVSFQRRAGHRAGSWDPVGGIARLGGRVYTTSMAALTLEVYYRYAPIHDGADLLAEIESIYTAGDGGIRADALDAYRQFGGGAYLRLCRRFADDPDGGVRSRAAAGLLEAGDGPPEERLVERLLRDGEEGARFRAAIRLAEEGVGGEAIETVLDAIRDGREADRFRAIRFVARKRTRSAVPYLIEGLTDPQAYLRKEALDALERITGVRLGPDPLAWLGWWENQTRSDRLRADREAAAPPAQPPVAAAGTFESLREDLDGVVVSLREGRAPPGALTRALLLIEKAEHPGLDIDRVERILDRIAVRLRERLGPNAPPERVLAAISALLYDELDFRTIDEDERGEDFYLGRVLVRRAGNCVGLAGLYLAIGERLDLPIVPVRSPGHVYVRYRTPDGGIDIEPTARGGIIAAGVDPSNGRKQDPVRAAAGYYRDITSVAFVAEVLNSCGARWAARENWTRALEDLDRAARIDPDYPVVHNNRGNALRRLGRVEEAIGAYTRGIAIDPASAELYANRGGAHMAGQDWDRVVADLDRALALDPSLASVYVSRAHVYRMRGDVERAIADLDRALALGVGAPALRARAELFRDTGRFEDAEQDLREAVRQDPATLRGWVALARVLRDRGDHGGAAGAARKALEIGPEDPAVRALARSLGVVE